MTTTPSTTPSKKQHPAWYNAVLGIALVFVIGAVLYNQWLALQDIRTEVVALKAVPAAPIPAPAAAVNEDTLQALYDRLTILTEKVAAMPTTIPAPVTTITDASAPVTDMLLFLYLQDQLVQRIEHGTSFQGTLHQYQQAAIHLGFTPDVAAIVAFSPTPSQDQLLRNAAAILPQHPTDTAPAATTVDTPWWQQLLDSVIQIKPVQAAPLTDIDTPDAAQSAFAGGNLDSVMHYIDTLPEQMRQQQDLIEWQEQAKKRQLLDQQLDDLLQQSEQFLAKHPKDAVAAE